MCRRLSEAANLRAPHSSSPRAIRLRLSIDTRTRSRGIVDNCRAVRTQVKPFQHGKELVIAERKISDRLRKFRVGNDRDLVSRTESGGDCIQAFLHLLRLLFPKVVVD